MSYEFFSFSKDNYINTLPQKLSLLTIQKSSLNLCLSPLIRLAFYSERLFSFTETPDEVSLIIEQDALEEFPSDPSIITISGQTYRALEVWEGGEALDCIGAVRQLALPLEDAAIPCVYLSTYNTDLILVEESDLPQALEVLEKSVGNSMHSHNNNNNKNSNNNNNNKEQQPQEEEEESSVRVKEAGSLNHTRHHFRLSLMTFHRKHAPPLLHPLLFQLLFTNGPRFFNFTATPKEITVITDQLSLSSFTSLSSPSSLCSPNLSLSSSPVITSPILGMNSPSGSSRSVKAEESSIVPSLVVNTDVWVAVELHSEGDSGHVEGMVSVVSDVLYHAKISMYYISTFTTDFFLVHEQDAEHTSKTLIP